MKQTRTKYTIIWHLAPVWGLKTTESMNKKDLVFSESSPVPVANPWLPPPGPQASSHRCCSTWSLRLRQLPAAAAPDPRLPEIQPGSASPEITPGRAQQQVLKVLINEF